MNQIHFQETSLKVAFCRAVVFQGIQEEGGALLDEAVLHEHIHDLWRWAPWMRGSSSTHARSSVHSYGLARRLALQLITAPSVLHSVFRGLLPE